MAQPTKKDLRKQGASAFMARRANETQCPSCKRKNAYTVAVDDSFIRVWQCRYCKFSRVWDKDKREFVEDAATPSGKGTSE